MITNNIDNTEKKKYYEHNRIQILLYIQCIEDSRFHV